MREIASAFATHPDAPVPFHNDLLNGNFLLDRDAVVRRTWSPETAA